MIRDTRKVFRIHNVRPGEVYIIDKWVMHGLDEDPSVYDYFYPGVGLFKREDLPKKALGYTAVAVSVDSHLLVPFMGDITRVTATVKSLDRPLSNGVVATLENGRRITLSKEFVFDAGVIPGRELFVYYDGDLATGASVACAAPPSDPDRITCLVKE